MKITITNKTKEFEGIIEDKVVTPFGNSAHITMSKKQNGKVVHIINPSEPRYAWVLNKNILKELVKVCKKGLESEDSRTLKYKKGALKNIQSKTFLLSDLSHVLDVVKKNIKNKELYELIKKTYNL